MITTLDKSQNLIEQDFLNRNEVTLKYLEQFSKSIYFWYCLRKGFRNIFAGYNFFDGLNIVNDNNRELIFLHYKYYMSFYELINFGWDELKSHIEELEIIYDWKLNTPGYFLDLIILSEASNWISQDKLPTPQYIYRACKAQEVNDLSNMNKYIEKIQKQVLNKKSSKESWLINDCLTRLKKSKNNVVKRLIKNFELAEKERIDFGMKKLRKTF